MSSNGRSSNLQRRQQVLEYNTRKADEKLYSVRQRTDSPVIGVKPESVVAIWLIPFTFLSFILEYTLRTLTGLGAVSRLYVEKE